MSRDLVVITEKEIEQIKSLKEFFDSIQNSTHDMLSSLGLVKTIAYVLENYDTLSKEDIEKNLEIVNDSVKTIKEKSLDIRYNVLELSKIIWKEGKE